MTSDHRRSQLSQQISSVFAAETDSTRLSISGTVPSCQCSDWDRNFSPRKHIPSVVRDFGWDCLPQQYRNLPVFVLDRDIVGDVSSHTLSQSAVADTVMESCRFASDVETDNDVAVSQLAVADTLMLKVLLKVHQSQQ